MFNFTDFDITIDKITWFSEIHKIKEWKFNTMEHPDIYQPNYYSLRFVTEGSQKTFKGKQPMTIIGKGVLALHSSERVPYKSFSHELPYRYYQIYFFTTSPLPAEIFENGSCELMPRETERLSVLYYRAREIWLTKGPLWHLELKTILTELLTIFFRNYYYRDVKTSITTLARRTADLIAAGITDGSLSVSGLAKAQYVSTEHLIRTFREAYGETPKQYINKMRLNRAAELLKSNKSPVADIAELSGFSSVFHFNKLFKLHFGATPSQFRKEKNPDYFLF